jgi:hypothetical protein
MDEVARSSQETVELPPYPKGGLGRGAEQRRDERYSVHGDAEILVVGGMSMFRGRIANISLSGCYVQTVAWVRLAPQTAVEVVFVVKGHVVRARAEARYSESKVGLGLRFLVMEEQMQRRLDSVLAGLRSAAVARAEAGSPGRSVLDALTDAATARADAVLRPAEGVDPHGFRSLPPMPPEAPQRGDGRFAGLEELVLSTAAELDREDTEAIAAMNEMEDAARTGSAVRRPLEGTVMRQASA